jgi:hypothetical protein
MTDAAVGQPSCSLGTYVDGRELTYDEAAGQFAVGGTPVPVDDVRAYDAAGQINWTLGTSSVWFHQSFPAQKAAPAAGMQIVPKCLHCGFVGPWKIEPLVRPIDWIITLVFLFLFGGGLIYLLVIIIIRSNENRRAKICANCGARNMFSFQY